MLVRRPEQSRFYDEAKRDGRYDFEAGRRLASAAQAVGLKVVHEGTSPDDELAFDGAAAPDVLEAWRERLRRMAGLKMFMGERFDDFVRSFLGTLSSPNHRSSARVCGVVARHEDGAVRRPRDGAAARPLCGTDPLRQPSLA